MKFEEYYKITIQQIHEEIEKDNRVALNITPLFESPMFHEADFFEVLNDIKTNHPFALERIKDSSFIEKVIINNAEYRLYRKTLKGQTWDFFISGKEEYELISAFITYISRDKIIEIKGLWQIDFVVGLVKGLINNYYSKHYSVLESDSIANSKGKKFFQKLANDYLQQGKSVVVSIKGKEIPYNLKDAESYWKSSIGVQAAEKIIIYNF